MTFHWLSFGLGIAVGVALVIGGGYIYLRALGRY